MKQENNPQNADGRLERLREYVRGEWSPVPVEGGDMEFRASLHLAYDLRGIVPGTGPGDVAKVLGSLGYKTTDYGSGPVWVMYRRDGKRRLECEFGLGDGPDAADSPIT